MHGLSSRSSRSLRSSLATRATLLVVALASCRDQGPVALAELDDPVLQVSWYHGSFGEPLALPRFYVQVSSHQDTDECAALRPDVEVTVGDAVLDATSLGGWVDDAVGRRCTIPTFELTGAQVNAHPLEESTTIELFDGESTFGVEARGLFVERAAALVEPAGGELFPGEPAALAWQPASDQLGLVGLFFYPPPTPNEESGAPLAVLSGPELAIDGDRIGFRVPALEPGPGVLRVEASADVPTEACRGFHRCDVAVLAVIRELPIELR